MFSFKSVNINPSSLSFVTSVLRNASTKPTTNGDILPMVFNRNPRNLERLRIARKPTGYVVDKKKVDYWHRLNVVQSGKWVVAQVVHHTNQLVIQASTKEWAIQKQLYSTSDKQAYITLAKVLAERCLESGIYSFSCFNENEEKIDEEESESDNTSNMQVFFKVLKSEGLMLKEPPVYEPEKIWHKTREKKPWTVLED